MEPVSPGAPPSCGGEEKLMKKAFVFPGQGAQYVGMGRDLADAYPAARAVLDRARAAVGPEYIDVFLQGPEDKLRDTRYTQVALFIVSVAAHEVLKALGHRADYVAGHSLGEYSALCAAGAFDFETGLALVKARGEAIGDAAARTPGTMAAIVGLDRGPVEDLCRQAAVLGVCEPVNINCPGQIVIAGAVAAVDEAVRLAQAAGSPKSVRLNVSGPFHSSLIEPAAARMAGLLAGSAIRPPPLPAAVPVDAVVLRPPRRLAGASTGGVAAAVGAPAAGWPAELVPALKE